MEMLKIFTRAFFIKTHYWNLKLSIVALPSDIIVLLKNEKKNHQNIIKFLHNARDTKKTLKRGKWKTKSIRKV